MIYVYTTDWIRLEKNIPQVRVRNGIIFSPVLKIMSAIRFREVSGHSAVSALHTMWNIPTVPLAASASLCALNIFLKFFVNNDSTFLFFVTPAKAGIQVNQN